MTMSRAFASAGTRDGAMPRPAGHALGGGTKFLCHSVRNIDEEGGIWRADAVYSVSPALPKGMRTIDAEVTVADCAERGIPTV